MAPTPEPRMVGATTFKAWWLRLIEIGEDAATPPDVRRLFDHLCTFGQRAGAVVQVVVEGPPRGGHVRGPMSGGVQLNPAFDWVGGQINVASLGQYPMINPEGLIAEIERVTGIKEHDS